MKNSRFWTSLLRQSLVLTWDFHQKKKVELKDIENLNETYKHS